MDWWPWSSKEAIGQKNLQNHIDRLNAEVKTLIALNLTDNNWTEQAINDLGNLNERNNKLLKDLKENKKTPLTGTPPAGTPPAGTLPAGNPDLPVGGTRKKRKNKKHKKKTYRH